MHHIYKSERDLSGVNIEACLVPRITPQPHVAHVEKHEKHEKHGDATAGPTRHREPMC